MNRIIQLDQHTTNLIAAGEVIERAASVVKELVENAIDASATQVTISLTESGLKEIIVRDNGTGMSPVDAKMCILPHATSKIRGEKDLFNIHTLGFRGEALPSIVAVSNFKLKTSEDGVRGVMYTFKAGEIVSEAMIAHPKGTEISVKNLFFNTPARLQNLQSQQIELSHIIEYVQKMALANPKIAFKLLNNERILLQSYGNNQLLEVVASIYGRDIARSMIEIFNDNGYFKIKGFVSKNNVSRSSKNHIHILVNGRVIRNAAITQAVVESYKDFLTISRHPIVVLSISVDPSLVDVNVHPAKLEVRFSSEAELMKLIKETIGYTLSKVNMIVQIGKEDHEDENKVEPQVEKIQENQTILDEVMVTEDTIEQDDSLNEEDQPSDLTLEETSEHEIQPIRLEDFYESEAEEELVVEEAEEEFEEETPTYRQQQYTMLEQESPLKDEEEQLKIPKLEYIGQLHGTYLLTQAEDGFYLIDQHAAAERINYEKITREFQKNRIISYELLIPIQLQFTASEAVLVNEYMEDIKKLGFVLEEFGSGTFTVREVPIWLFRGREKDFTEEIIQQIIDRKKFEKAQFLDNLAKSLACKKSIKANEYLSSVQIEYMLSDLEKCAQPYTCPHGRPVIIRFPKNEIERWFKRVQ